MPWPQLQRMEITVIATWALLAAFTLAATQIALWNLSLPPSPSKLPRPHAPSRPSHTPSSAPGTLGAVASESKICSQIGIDLLKAGGNAADALVGTSACVGVIGMYHSGIGGGGFMLIRGTDGEYEVVDCRESAPAAAYEDMYTGNVDGSVKGGLARYVGGISRRCKAGGFRGGLQELTERVLQWCPRRAPRPRAPPHQTRRSLLVYRPRARHQTCEGRLSG